MTDDWQEPGNKLRTAREAKGLSLLDVSHQTRIPRRVIEALENDDYGAFPSPTYAKSFLAQYAGFVGVDPSEWMDFFEPAIFSPADENFSVVEPVTAYEARASALPHHDSPPARRHSVMPTFMLIGLTAALGYVGILGWEYIEGRYGDKTSAKQELPAAAKKHEPGTPETGSRPGTPNRPAKEPSEGATEVALKPPPRAIIVPETD